MVCANTCNSLSKWHSLGLTFLYYLLILLVLQLGPCAGQTPSQCGRKDKVQMTVMSFPQNSESPAASLPHYECYLGAEDGDAAVSSYEANRLKTPIDQAQILGTNLPINTAAYTVSLDTSDNAFGVFTCDASKDGRQDTTIFTIFLRSDGYIFPSDQLLTKTVSVGDTDVIINMTVADSDGIPTTSGRLDIRWRINGSNSIDNPSGGGAYINKDYELLSRSQGIIVGDEGVYEAHGFTLRNARRALQRLMVRSCKGGKWGPPGCNGICDNCYNGGVCDDETGRCICPPGFMGTNCLTACDANTFGYSCEFQCGSGGNSDCVGRQFCLLDPYGCTCNTGYKNLDCMAECVSDRFGAGCSQECHCASGGCNRFTGVCDSGNCQTRWSGTNCQKCPDGFYGDCSEECHCESDACDKATGGCVGCCKPQWLDAGSNTCQIGLEGSSFTKVNSGQSTTVICEASQGTPAIYATELSRERDSHVVDSRISRGNTMTVSAVRTTTFTISNVSSTDVFYCLLVSGTGPVAWLNTAFSVYELPVLNDPPTSPGQTNDSVTIRWRAWDTDMDVGDPPVVSYITYYKEVAADTWMKGSNVSSDEPLESTASDLKMDVNYTFSVAAVREGEGGEGPRSPSVTAKTLCGAPAVPMDVQASLTDDNKVEVTWQIPTGNALCSTGIKSFTIFAQMEGSIEEPLIVATVGRQTTSHIISDGLEGGESYIFYVSLTTDQESARSSQSEAVLYPDSSPVVFIVIIVIIFVIVLAIIISLVVVKRCFFGKGSQDKSKSETDRVDSAVYTNAGVSDEPGGYTTLELDSTKSSTPSEYHHIHQGQNREIFSEYEETDMNKEMVKARGLEYGDAGYNKPGRYNLSKPPPPQSNNEVQSEDHNYEEPGDFENYTGVYINTQEKNKLSPPEPIQVSEFQNFMRKDKMQIVEGIVKEFMMLLKGKQHSCSEAEEHQVVKKNSQGILPYDHSRVKLTSFGNLKQSDYYNASYVKNHKGKVTFIAAQGPGSKYKISDFWRMIWQEKVKTIVMLTDSDQPGGAKPSAVYWPDKVETYGEITVLGMESTSYNTYTVRKMKVLQNDDERNHTVQQIQLHMWPFRGVPEDISDLIAVIKKVKVLQRGGTTGPLLVHCSNGSGATGTFVAIYTLMDVLNESKTISVFDFVNKMRKDRMDMVQTRIQYLFIYETLRDAQLFPEDSSLCCIQLKNLSDNTLNRKAEREFKVLRKMSGNSRRTECKVGTLATNVHKNRFKGILPLDKYRATLKSEGLTHGSSDYINATIAENDGSRYTVMTQSPLPATLEDFWRLVFDYQCSTIIMLDNTNNVDKTVVQYWPDGKATYVSITVDLVTTMKFDTFTKRTFTVTHQDFKEYVTVEQLGYDGFGNSEEIDVNKLAKFINSTQNDTTKTSVVHCINGVGLSAVYVAVRSQMESIRNGDECDVFLAVQKLRMRNPHAIQTQDEYMLCLQLLRSILNNQEEYAVIY